MAIPGDITDETFCSQMVERAAKDRGGLDILVNNAGTMSSHPNLLEVTSADFDKVMKTNVCALFWITQAAIPHLQPGASIINTASILCGALDHLACSVRPSRTAGRNCSCVRAACLAGR